MNKLGWTAAVSTAAMTLAAPAMAAKPAKDPVKELAVCALGDISPAALACTGFFAGNLISGNATDIAAQKSALLTLGYAWNGTNVEKLAELAGSKTVDFSTPITGISYVGFHFGGGNGGPGNATAFYKIDGGTGLDVITLAYKASSNAALYAVTEVLDGGGDPNGTVPEPAAWALMIAGFGTVGLTMRRKSLVVAA